MGISVWLSIKASLCFLDQLVTFAQNFQMQSIYIFDVE